MAAPHFVRSVILAGIWSAMLLPCAGAAEGTQPRYVGSQSCASASCHGGDPRFTASGPSRDEYTRWLECDPHARSARTLSSDSFRRILSIASTGRPDGPPDAQVALRCQACHDPQNIANAPASATRGIGCESCHGPAERWLAVHYRDDLSRESLRELGMIDTTNLLVRAKECAGCHVGGAERDMNHDMIAAGHPPLRFELSAYHDLIERKHWTDAERINTPHFKVQLWTAGQLATAEASLALLESRAKRAAAADKHAPWPEFAEFDCFACHQRLRPAPFSSVALQAPQAGVPGWQPWNLALTGRQLPHDANQAANDLRSFMGRSLDTDPAAAEQLAAAARRQIERHPLRSGSQFDTSALLDILTAPTGAEPSWAEHCQQLLALKAAYLATRDEARKLDSRLRLVSSSEVPMTDDPLVLRLEKVGRSLSFPAAQFEWPAYDWAGLPEEARRGQAPPLAGAGEITAELQSIADELRRRTSAPSPDSY